MATRQAAFERSFARDGLGALPWIEAPFMICPGGLVAENRANHSCQFVSANDKWVWESDELIREDKRSLAGADEGFRAIARKGRLVEVERRDVSARGARQAGRPAGRTHPAPAGTRNAP